MDKFLKICKILREFTNSAAGISAYESPARPWKTIQKKKVEKKNLLRKI